MDGADPSNGPSANTTATTTNTVEATKATATTQSAANSRIGGHILRPIGLLLIVTQIQVERKLQLTLPIRGTNDVAVSHDDPFPPTQLSHVERTARRVAQ